MSSSLNEIEKLVKPPAKPVGLDRPWDAVEQELGSFLPADYKAFIDHYGSGLVCGMIAVWNLRDKTCFPAPVKDYLLGESSVIASFKQSTVTPSESWFPEPDGLLPFCTVIDVHHVMWRTKGKSDEWRCVFWFSDGDEFIDLEEDSFSDFLLKVLTKHYEIKQIPTLEAPYTFTDFSNW